MRKGILVGGFASLVLAATILGAAGWANAQATQTGQAPVGPWMMGPGMIGCNPGMMGWSMMGPGMMGPGMMGPGTAGPGMMVWGWGQQPANLNLSATDVQGYLQQWIVMAGNPRIKVGTVAEEDADTITADIVTTEENALVQRFSINRHTGVYSLVR